MHHFRYISMLYIKFEEFLFFNTYRTTAGIAHAINIS